MSGLKKEEVLTEVKFTVNNVGIASIIDIECLRCGKLERVGPRISNYTYHNMKELVTSKKIAAGTILI